MNAHKQLNALRIPHATFDITLSAVWLDTHICSSQKMHQNYALCTIRGCTMNTRHSLSSFFSGEEIFKNPKSTPYFPPLFLMVKGSCSTASAYDVTQWTVVSNPGIQLKKKKAKS